MGYIQKTIRIRNIQKFSSVKELNIITRVTRLDNLAKVKESVFRETEIKVIWHVVFDMNFFESIPIEIMSWQDAYINLYFQRSNKDYLQPFCSEIAASLALSSPDSSIYFLDDDNTVHEDLYPYFEGTDLNWDVLVLDQFVGGKDFTGLHIRLGKPENMKVQHVDIAQCIFHARLFSRYQWSADYKGDGHMIEQMLRDGNKFEYTNQILSNYNFLQEPKTAVFPKILVIGSDKKLATIKDWGIEETRLDVLNEQDDKNIVSNLVNFNPDAILTVGESWEQFPRIASLPYSIRKKWLHVQKVELNTGTEIYNCAMAASMSKTELISYFTPTYKTGETLLRTYGSLAKQDDNDWEWVILNDSNCNTLQIAKALAQHDYRVKVYSLEEKSGGLIGDVKYKAASLCKGFLLCELDHDDLLTSDCTSTLRNAAHAFPDAGFFYSDCAEVDDQMNSLRYHDGFCFGYGKYEEENGFDKCCAVPINPKTIRHIVGVPNHIRVWRRDAYFKAGGHNRDLPIADDYELIVRTFLTTEMVHIPKLLYIQFYHQSNSQNIQRADIQRRARTIAAFYNEDIKKRFEELGKEDWCYQNGIETPSRFENEQNVNLIWK